MSFDDIKVSALLAAEIHLEHLATGVIPNNQKPSAFHHGLLTSLVAEYGRMLETAKSLERECDGLREELRERSSSGCTDEWSV